jgi:maltooligosyltrehalose trehalohydrolase
MTALLLLAPAIPLLFQGQEFAASAPFRFFADHRPQLSRKVAAGRREFLSQFPSIATSEVQRQLPDPGATETFRRCVLDHAERDRNAPMLALHRDLIALSRTPPFLQARRATTEGAVLSPDCLLLRFLADDESQHRLLIVNLGEDLRLAPLPEPLLAPPRDQRWALAWSSEETRYGGLGAPDTVASEPAWLIPGWAAVVLRPLPRPGATI